MDKQELIKGFKDSIEQAEYYVDYLQNDERQKAEWLIRLEERKNALFFAEPFHDTQEPCEMCKDVGGMRIPKIYFADNSCVDEVWASFCPKCGFKLGVE